MCGENPALGNTITEDAGSSPRVRGKQAAWNATNFARGLIPACAGKTRNVTAKFARRSAHPRVCGENAEVRRGCGCVAGSSPRVRGKPNDPGAWRYPVGLIPACAGKTLGLGRGDESCWAHPRVCGENPASSKRSSGPRGSSPRVRGKLRT